MVVSLVRFSISTSRFLGSGIPLQTCLKHLKRRPTRMVTIRSQRFYSNVPESPLPIEDPSDRKVYVQYDHDKDLMFIAFDFDFNGRKKQFNLNRKSGESLASTLERIRLNIGKLNKKIAIKGHQSSTVPNVFFHNNGSSIDPNSTSNLEAWVEGAYLELDGTRYQVKTNEPQVASIKLPSPMMKGFVILPSVNLSNCDISNCIFTWHRKISSEERELLIQDNNPSEYSIEFDGSYWLKLTESLTYSPIEDDVAHFLKVVCHPSNGQKWGPSHSCISSTPVELGPKLCPFETRHQLTKEKFIRDRRFRFVTYNILADLYADSDYSRTVLFGHCPPHALEIEYRRQLLLKELYGYNADIICLQEVDKKEFVRTYSPFFQLVSGHSGVFDAKGGQVAEGVAMFYRDERFKLIESHKIVLSKLIDPYTKANENDDSVCINETDPTSNNNETKTPDDMQPDQSDLGVHPILNDLSSADSIELLRRFDAIREKILSHLPLKKRFLGLRTVLQLSLLRFTDVPSTYLIVANTHLYFAPDADHIRLLQGSVCVKYIEYIKEYYKRLIELEKGSSCSKVSVVFTGDMNSTPDCGLFSLLQSGIVRSELADWSSNTDEAVEGLEIETPLRFMSAYQDIPYTNFTPGFNGCLDYIYYELDSLSCESTVPLPNHEDVTAIKGLPSDVFPSDHLALIANLKFRE